MKLTATAIKNAKPKEKQYKLPDGAGLYLLVKASGKYWRYNYRYLGKYKTLSLGIYPTVSLKQAREAHQLSRKQLSEGTDPAHQRKIDKSLKQMQAEDSFKAIALEWLENNKATWVETHYKNLKSRLQNHVFGYIGTRPVVEITAPELLAMLRRIESAGYNETAHRVRSLCGQIFRYAIVTGRAERDPSADLRGALVAVKSTSFATITDPVQIGYLLRAIEDYTGDFVTLCALKLAPLVFVRPSELRRAEWSEIDFDKKEWLIPAEKMKMREAHIVPLSTQAIEILESIKPFTANRKSGDYIFPSVRTNTRPMSENTINGALRRLGYTKEEITGHGFRAMASTLLNEQGFRPDVIERQLAHAERNKVRAVYNRAEYLPERKAMMQSWADYLDSLKAGAEIIPIKRA